MSEPTGSGPPRVPTGLLASIARTQATHPKRTVFGGLGFVLIMFLALGPLKGTLENKFSIPGSDAQKATDVLKAKFGERNGAVLQVVMVSPDGERLDTPERKAAIDARAGDGRQGRVGDRREGPVRGRQPAFSKTDPRIAYAEAQFDKDGSSRPRQGRRGRGRRCAARRAGGHPGRVQR